MITDPSVALIWFTLAIPLLSFPTGFPVTAEGMNCEWSPPGLM